MGPYLGFPSFVIRGLNYFFGKTSVPSNQTTVQVNQNVELVNRTTQIVKRCIHMRTPIIDPKLAGGQFQQGGKYRQKESTRSKEWTTLIFSLLANNQNDWTPEKLEWSPTRSQWNRNEVLQKQASQIKEQMAKSHTPFICTSATLKTTDKIVTLLFLNATQNTLYLLINDRDELYPEAFKATDSAFTQITSDEFFTEEETTRKISS